VKKRIFEQVEGKYLEIQAPGKSAFKGVRKVQLFVSKRHVLRHAIGN
jgi:hypothetical protein